jgi:hypothetical protein
MISLGMSTAVDDALLCLTSLLDELPNARADQRVCAMIIIIRPTASKRKVDDIYWPCSHAVCGGHRRSSG